MPAPNANLIRLLIASAIDPALYRRLLDSPEPTFDAFALPESDRELLRHPDHRLLPILGSALAQSTTPISASNAVSSKIEPATPSHISASALPDLSLLLTLTPCALYEGTELRNFAFAAWVTALPESVDPATLPPPPGTTLPGRPLPPLRAVIRVSALQLQDPAGNPLVGLTAHLQNATNMSAPPPPETAGNPAAPQTQTPEIQSAITAVRTAPAPARYEKILDLLQLLHPEVTK